MISGIVVLYEPSQNKLENIRDYYKLLDALIVIDNSSHSNYELVQKIVPEIYPVEEGKYTSAKLLQYVYYGENRGLCVALNDGVKRARYLKSDWALFMDDDSSWATNLVSVYKEVLSQVECDKVAVLSPVHLYDRSSAHISKGYQKIPWAMTSGCLYNIDIFEKIGGFTERLFLECLDIEYCYRANAAGYHVYKCGGGGLWHQPAETRSFKFLGKTVFKYGYAAPWRYEMQCRNLIWIYLKYHRFRDLETFLWKWAKVILLFKNKKEYFLLMRKGTREGLRWYREEKDNSVS